jgi:hypothetical protein
VSDVSKRVVYERLREVPAIVKAFCFGFDGIVVGGSAKFLTGDAAEVNDWDVVIPPHKWHDASKIIPYKSETNTFGGVKVIADGVCVDVWAECLVHYFASIGSEFDPIAVNIKTKQVITASKR